MKVKPLADREEKRQTAEGEMTLNPTGAAVPPSAARQLTARWTMLGVILVHHLPHFNTKPVRVHAAVFNQHGGSQRHVEQTVNSAF